MSVNNPPNITAADFQFIARFFAVYISWTTEYRLRWNETIPCGINSWKKIQFCGLQIFAQDLNWRRFTVWTSWTWCHWVFKNWNNIEECQHFTLNRWVAIVWKTFHKKSSHLCRSFLSSSSSSASSSVVIQLIETEI